MVRSLSAFADDIGVSVGDVIRILMVLVLVLGSIGAAKLKRKKLHNVNFSKMSISILKNRPTRRRLWHLELRSVIALSTWVSLLALVPRVRLGMLPAGSFSSELGKRIKILGLSPIEAVLAFCVFAFSVIRFSLQLVPLSFVLLWHFGLALDICSSSPQCSLVVSVLCSLRRMGMPVEVPDLPYTSRATMFRTAIGSEVMGRAAGEVCAVRNSDEAVFHPRHSDWLTALLYILLWGIEVDLPRSLTLTPWAVRRFQWGVMKILRGNLDARALHGAISKRLQFFNLDT